MGWASGFAAGTQMARGWIDTYKDVKESTGRGLANQEILAAQQERERQMQQAVTPGISSGPEQNMSPSATPATAATLAQNKLPMAPSAGGVGTPPQMSPVTLATPDLIKDQRPAQPAGDGRQRRTGLGNLDVEIAKETDVLDIYRKYNLRDEIASQEKKISGLKSAYEEKSRYERDSDIAAEERAYTREQDALVNKRLQSELDSADRYRAQQIKESVQRVGAAQTEQNLEQLDRDADDAIRLATVNGRPLSDIAAEVPEAYRENPSQWQAAIAKQYMASSKLTATDFGQVIKKIVSPIDQLLNTRYATEEAKVDAYNEKLADLDPDASDDLLPKLFPKDDGGWGLLYGKVIIMEGATPEDIAQKYKAGVLADPYGHALDRIDFLRVKALKDASKLTTAESKREFLSKLAEENPAILKDQTLREQLLEAVGFDTGGIDPTNSRWNSATTSIAGYGGGGGGGGELTAVQIAAAALGKSEQEQGIKDTTAKEELRARQENAAAATPQIIFALTEDGIEETFGGADITPSRAQRIALQVRMNGGDLQDYKATIGKGLGGNLVIGGANTGIRTVD